MSFIPIFSIFLLILYLITAGFITHASILLGPNTADPEIDIAYHYATWCSVIPWLLLGFSILGLILYIYLSVETGGELQLVKSQAEGSSGWWTFFFIIMLVLISISGILAAACVHHIQISNLYIAGNVAVVSAFSSSLITAILCLGIIIILIGGLIYRAVANSESDPTPIPRAQAKPLNKLQSVF